MVTNEAQPAGRKRILSGTLFSLGLALLPAPALRGDGEWSGWRGVARDGRAAGVSLPARWPEALTEVWRVTVGEGHSSPIEARGRLHVIARQGEEEVVLALEPDTGKEVWRASYRAPYEMDPAARSHGKGPKSTPVEKDGRLYTLGIGGVLSSFESDTGALRWRKEFAGQYPRTSPLYGTAMSPLLEGGLLIVHIGGHDRGSLVAFDAATGETRWSLDGDGPGYASPIVVDAGGTRQVVTQTQTRVIGVEAASGKLIWSFPYKTPYDQNSVTPVAWGGMVVISGLDQGVQAVAPGKPPGGGAPPVLWRTADVSMYMSTPVVDRDVLFGFSHKRRGEIFAMDPKGSVLWRSDGGLGENAALVSAGRAIIALLDDAELIVFRPDRDRFDVIARRKVAATPTWAHPLLRGNRLWVKDRTSLICWSLEAAGGR